MVLSEILETILSVRLQNKSSNLTEAQETKGRFPKGIQKRMDSHYGVAPIYK